MTQPTNTPTFYAALNMATTAGQAAYDLIMMMFALACMAFIKHALQLRKVSGPWSVNSLVRLLVADQLVYFLWYLFILLSHTLC